MQYPLVKAEKLSKIYPKNTSFFNKSKQIIKAIDDVSFEINRKETYTLLGKIGSGKSSIGLALLRLIEPDSGKSYYNNICLNDLKQNELRKLRKDLQIVFQEAELNPVFNVFMQMKEVLLHHKICDKSEIDSRIMYLLELVGLDFGIMKKFPKELSKGQRQRVCIARVLSLEPKFIVLDEVTSALDSINQNKIIDLLFSLKEKFNLSYLFITHNLKLAKIFSDRIGFINNGKLIREGKVSDFSEDIEGMYR